MSALLDFEHAPLNKRAYGGLSGAKIGVTYEGENYLLKFPRNERDKGLKNVDITYSNSPVCEYLGSHIYALLGIPVHETHLGMRGGKVVVGCKDFLSRGDNLQEFRELKTTFEPFFLNAEGDVTDGNDTEMEEILLVLNEHPRLKDKPEAKQRFWDMFLVDALIGNSNRNNGNWGLILRLDDTEELAPVYDNGGCLNNKWDEKKMEQYLDDSSMMMTQSYKGVVCVFKQKDKCINPYQFLARTKDKDCLKALKRLYPLIKANKQNIMQLVEDTPTISETQKTFYKKILTLRMDYGLKQAYEKQFGVRMQK